jgi:hypothetical protein
MRREGTTEVIPYYLWMARNRVVARAIIVPSFCRFAALLLLYGRSAAPSAALRVSACGLKLEGATTSTPAYAKAAHAGDPGACGSEELIF